MLTQFSLKPAAPRRQRSSANEEGLSGLTVPCDVYLLDHIGAEMERFADSGGGLRCKPAILLGPISNSTWGTLGFHIASLKASWIRTSTPFKGDSLGIASRRTDHDQGTGCCSIQPETLPTLGYWASQTRS